MSDFIYSKKSVKKGKLSKEIENIYSQDNPLVEEFHGEWGSLAVSKNLYNGFSPYETDEHICIVIGGPVLCFRDNNFLRNDFSIIGTKAIYDRWINGRIQWDEDLSGPFVILIVNKKNSKITCITDLMSFIPVYVYQESENILLSTHVDMLGRVSNQRENVDVISKVDFILHGTVTFPYTVYTRIKQVFPASINIVQNNSVNLQQENYWVPEERYRYKSINDASKDLRIGLKNYVNSIASDIPHVAQFISGGEDSRTLSALIPKKCKRDAFVFLDHMNREGKVAKEAADAYGAHFNIATRSKLHYFEVMSPSVDLVGDGSQYYHAHAFGFHKSCNLNEYPAVFGGLLSDALLKGSHIKKMRGSSLLPFLPQIKRSRYSVAGQLSNRAFKSEILQELRKRRLAHLNYVRNFRTKSAEEWFELWPSSMNINMANLSANRRLFRSYEPFMAKEVVKISATVPQNWKLNRRLFQKAVKPLLKPTKWLFHSDGRLPYFPWYINSLVQFVMWSYQQVGSRTGIIKGNQGPWGEWNVVMNSSEWEHAIDRYSTGLKVIEHALNVQDVNELFKNDYLNEIQRINLMQTLYCNQRKKHENRPLES